MVPSSFTCTPGNLFSASNKVPCEPSDEDARFITVLDDGIEVSMGLHAANNIFASLMITNKASVLQTQAVFSQQNIDPNKETLALLVMSIVFIAILKYHYKWDFKVLNKKELQEKHFDKKLNKCLLNESGKKIFVKAFEERLNETIQHRTLNRSVSYKHLIKLECYKLSKHLLGMEEYKPFKMWW